MASSASQALLPHLEHCPTEGEPPVGVLLDPIPFRMGRGGPVQFTIHAQQVSKEHAEIYQVGDQYCIRDLRSTNGTFVNGQRIEEALLVSGDIVHIAHEEFRFVLRPVQVQEDSEPPMTDIAKSGLPPSFIRGTEHLRDMLREHCVRIVFQPIVDLETATPVAFEALGRGTHSDLSIQPGHLFQLAERCGLTQELSRLFREAAVEEAHALPESCLLFLNTHPSELGTADFLTSIDAIACRLPRERVVIEIHEDTSTEMTTLCQLRVDLNDRGMMIAYDDFGSGQSRLTELADVPPDFIKLDLRLIRGIHRDGGRQSLVQAINQITEEFGIRVIAEGIETAEEAAMCRMLGCHLGQGYLFGKPDSAEAFGAGRKHDTRLSDLSELRRQLDSRKA